MAQHQQDARLIRPDAGLDQPLVCRQPRARRQHGDAVVLGELAEARIEPGLLTVGLVDAGLEVVDDPAGGTPPKYSNARRCAMIQCRTP